MASLVQPKENDRIYDPTCGSGGLLLKAYKKLPSGKVAIYGQELNAPDLGSLHYEYVPARCG